MLESGFVMTVDSRQYTIIKVLGQGANTIAYLAESRNESIATRCILKEYSPYGKDDFEEGKKRFIDSGRKQNEIRQISTMSNQTPPVSHIFETNGTAYIDVACYNGTTLDKLDDLDLLQYMEVCRAIAKTVGYYHNSGYLCLDLKPENIFVLQNAPDDMVTQIVEFIDFDSIRDISSSKENSVYHYTREWAAPEQLNHHAGGKISEAVDIYIMGEIVFYLLFGRHSTETEHRGFSKYPFEICKSEYRNYIERPEVQALFTKIFHGTIRSSATNRFKSIHEVTKHLDEIVDELQRKDYIIPILPSVSPDFVGRDTELRQIAESLKINPVLFITGIGGIGKSTLVKNFISKNKTDYDTIIYLEFDGDIQHTFCDDMQLRISTVSRQDHEPLREYFTRKCDFFRRICFGKHVLFVLDNFSGKITKDLSSIIDGGYDTIIVTRNQPPKNSFAYIEIGAIDNTADIFHLVAQNLGKPLTKEERLCFEEIIALVQGHTLIIELITRQIGAGKLNIQTALDLIRENGFFRFSENKISNYKDGEEVYETLSVIVSALFDATGMSTDERLALKILALLDVRGLETSFVYKFFPDVSKGLLTGLSDKGWLYKDNRIRLHSVIAETVQNWPWHSDDISVMEYHKRVIDIYVGMANDVHIRKILREGKVYKDEHPRHIITAMYYDMLGCYYDTLIDGNYVAYNAEEAELIEKLISAMDAAIEEMEISSDRRKVKYLAQYYLSMASVLMRSVPDHYDKARDLLDKAHMLIEENETEIRDKQCYYYMVSAWYYTLVDPNIAKTKSLTKKAEIIAKQVFSTDLEVIDIVYVPAANCFFYHNDFRMAAEKLEEAIDICKQYPDTIPYIDKRAELMNCLLDVYMELQDLIRCRKLIVEIDQINEKYKDQGIYREISPEIREKAGL